MPTLSLPLRALRSPLSRRFAALAAVPALLVAAPARADDCAEDYDCGYGFRCETVVTSVASTGTGGAPGAAGKGGAAGYSGGGGYAGAGFAGGAPRGGTAGTGVGGGVAGAGIGGASTGGTANGGTTSLGGTDSSGGISGTAGVAGVGGTTPPTVCGNRYCEILVESPETCPLDCAYTTVCEPVPCTGDSQCAGGYICPASGTAGAGGTGSSGFCGDLLCSAIEDISICPYDCDPSLRRCTPGTRGCFSDAECAPGWRCSYMGGASDEAPATGGAGGGAGEAFGGGAGAAGGGAVPAGGANGMVAVGTCVPEGVGGTSGGTNGTGATGGSTRGGSGNQGGSDVGQANDDGDVVMTRGCGCSLAPSSDHSSVVAALVAALAVLVSFGRRRVRRTD